MEDIVSRLNVIRQSLLYMMIITPLLLNSILTGKQFMIAPEMKMRSCALIARLTNIQCFVTTAARDENVSPNLRRSTATPDVGRQVIIQRSNCTCTSIAGVLYKDLLSNYCTYHHRTSKIHVYD